MCVTNSLSVCACVCVCTAAVDLCDVLAASEGEQASKEREREGGKRTAAECSRQRAVCSLSLEQQQQLHAQCFKLYFEATYAHTHMHAYTHSGHAHTKPATELPLHILLTGFDLLTRFSVLIISHSCVKLVMRIYRIFIIQLQ